MSTKKEKAIGLHCATVMPVYIDSLVGLFGLSREEATNELLLALIACANELHVEEQALTIEPLKTVTETIFDIEAGTIAAATGH